jgi:predicted enzyme related to lactoylglutathione lyase
MVTGIKKILSDAVVGQVLIPVTNLEQAVEFYRYTLGLPFLFTAPPQMAFFQCGSVRLLVGVPPESTPYQRGSTVYFQVSDIQSAHTELSERGVEFQAQPHIVHRTSKQTCGWQNSDPDGNVHALMSETPAA